MEFSDCNTWIGAPVSGCLFKPETAKSLIAVMDKAGIVCALLYGTSRGRYKEGCKVAEEFLKGGVFGGVLSPRFGPFPKTALYPRRT